jgi:SAM-dependent methyltransferase
MSGAGRERERVERVYAGYREDRRRRRAWSAGNAGNAAIREEVIRALLELAPAALAGEGLVLDAGCGTGWWLGRLAQEGVAASRLVGVDLLTERARAARERVPGARVLAGDVRQLPVPAGGCSLVRAVLGGELRVRTLTLAPPLARRAGGRLYGPLARISPLRTHRLVVASF